MFQFNREDDFYWSQLTVWANNEECHVRHRVERKELDMVCSNGYEALREFTKQRQSDLLDDMGRYIANRVGLDLKKQGFIDD